MSGVSGEAFVCEIAVEPAVRLAVVFCSKVCRESCDADFGEASVIAGWDAIGIVA